MPSLPPRIPSQDSKIILLLYCRGSAPATSVGTRQSPAAKTCHVGWAASILLSLTDVPSFAPDSHGAADAGIHRLLACFFGWCVSFFQGDSLWSELCFQNKTHHWICRFQLQGLSFHLLRSSSHPQPSRSRDTVIGVQGELQGQTPSLSQFLSLQVPHSSMTHKSCEEE